MSSSEPVVITRQLTKKYGSFTAVDNLSLTLEKGNILGFIGPNGAGKTTTIRILVGLARPTSGSAEIAGADCVTQAKKIRRLVGYMPDKFGSYDNMRVREYLDFFGAAFGIRRRKRRVRIEEVMETTNSTYMQDKFVNSLSHGMQQRIGIARTLLHDPKVLILDEPANGLDPQARIEMRELLLTLSDMGKTLIVTSHILPELSRICNQVAIISNGKLQACGALSDIMKQVQQERTIEIQLSAATMIAQAQSVMARFESENQGLSVSEAESIIRFRTTRDEQGLGEILSTLVNNDVPVTQFRELQTDLEDAFLSVTQQPANSAETADSSANVETAV